MGLDTDKLKTIISFLLHKEEIDKKHRLHQLSGDYKDRYECHIEPDWLLIFKKEKNIITFERTGSHTKLFK